MGCKEVLEDLSFGLEGGADDGVWDVEGELVEKVGDLNMELVVL